MELLFPFGDYWWAYLAFMGLVLGLLALDLGVFHRHSHEVSVKEAATWSVVWITLALLFGVGLYFYSDWRFATDARLLAQPGFDPDAAARSVGLEYLTGFVVEKALAVDNLFVFVMIFSYFGIPRLYQHKILFYGIIGALAFRAGFIALGSVLMQYHAVVIFFGVFLIATGIKMLVVPEGHKDPAKNPVVRLLRRFMPLTDKFHGSKFVVHEGGKWVGTPLLLALALIEFSDIVFAVDSVPAIFAITREPFIVFTSNIFAILGLRSLFFLLAGVVDRFHLLKYGLAAVLVFVGLKMTWLNSLFGGKFPIGLSLGIIFGLIGASIAASLLSTRPKRDPDERARELADIAVGELTGEPCAEDDEECLRRAEAGLKRPSDEADPRKATASASSGRSDPRR